MSWSVQLSLTVRCLVLPLSFRQVKKNPKYNLLAGVREYPEPSARPFLEFYSGVPALPVHSYLLLPTIGRSKVTPEDPQWFQSAVRESSLRRLRGGGN